MERSVIFLFPVQVACALYEAAVAKYEAVLEMDPRNRPILRNCAFAMYDLGTLQPDPASRAARQLLEVSIIAAAMYVWNWTSTACSCLEDLTLTLYVTGGASPAKSS